MKVLLCCVFIFISLLSYSYCLSEDDKMPVEQWKAYKVSDIIKFMNHRS